MGRISLSACGLAATSLFLFGCNSDTTQEVSVQWEPQSIALQGAAQDPFTIDVDDLILTNPDPDISIVGVTGSSHGQLSLENGEAVYKADNRYYGFDEFTVTLSDGERSETVTVNLNIGQRLTFTGQVTHGDFENGSVALFLHQEQSVATASTSISNDGNYSLNAVLYGQDLQSVPVLVAQSEIVDELTLTSRLPSVSTLFDIHYTHGEINRAVEHGVQITPLSTAHNVLLTKALEGQEVTPSNVRKASKTIDTQVWIEMGAAAALAAETPDYLENVDLSMWLANAESYNSFVESVSVGGEQSLLAVTIEALATNEAVTPMVEVEEFVGEYLQEQQAADFAAIRTFAQVSVGTTTFSINNGPQANQTDLGRFPRQNYSYTFSGSTINFTPVEGESESFITFNVSPAFYIQDPQTRANFTDRFGTETFPQTVTQEYKEARILSAQGDYYLVRLVGETTYPEFTITDEFGDFVVPETTVNTVNTQRWLNVDEITTDGALFENIATTQWLLDDLQGFFSAEAEFVFNTDGTMSIANDEILHRFGTSYALQNLGWNANWSILDGGNQLEIIIRDSNDDEVSRVVYSWVDSTPGKWQVVADYSNPEGETYSKLAQITRTDNLIVDPQSIIDQLDTSNMLVSAVNSRVWQWVDSVPQENFEWFGFQFFDDFSGYVPQVLCINPSDWFTDYCGDGVVTMAEGVSAFSWSIVNDAFLLDRGLALYEQFPSLCSVDTPCYLRDIRPIHIDENGLIAVIEGQRFSHEYWFGEPSPDYGFVYQIQPRINYYTIADLPNVQDAGANANETRRGKYRTVLPREMNVLSPVQQ